MGKAFLQTGQTLMAGQKMQMPWGNFATRHRLNQAIRGKRRKIVIPEQMGIQDIDFAGLAVGKNDFSESISASLRLGAR